MFVDVWDMKLILESCSCFLLVRILDFLERKVSVFLEMKVCYFLDNYSFDFLGVKKYLGFCYRIYRQIEFSNIFEVLLCEFKNFLL